MSKDSSPIEFTQSELEWLSTDPTALRSLADWYHMIDLSNGIGDDGVRRQQLKAAADHFDRRLSEQSRLIMKEFTQ